MYDGATRAVKKAIHNSFQTINSLVQLMHFEAEGYKRSKAQSRRLQILIMPALAQNNEVSADERMPTCGKLTRVELGPSRAWHRSKSLARPPRRCRHGKGRLRPVVERPA